MRDGGGLAGGDGSAASLLASAGAQAASAGGLSGMDLDSGQGQDPLARVAPTAGAVSNATSNAANQLAAAIQATAVTPASSNPSLLGVQLSTTAAGSSSSPSSTPSSNLQAAAGGAPQSGPSSSTAATDENKPQFPQVTPTNRSYPAFLNKLVK